MTIIYTGRFLDMNLSPNPSVFNGLQPGREVTKYDHDMTKTVSYESQGRQDEEGM